MTSPGLQEQIIAAMQENASLKERMSILEKANRQQRRSRLILLFVFLGYIFSQYFQSQTFSGRWWAIHDRQDRISAWFDDNGLELKDAIGTVRARLGLLTDGSPILQFFDKQSHVRAQLFQYTDGSGYLMLWDKDGKGVRYPPSATPLP